MRVTRIEELTKSRSRVYIDEEFAFVLYKGELRSYRIVVGEELAPEDYETIMGQVLPKRAKLRAMNLLKSREYTTKQLHDKLKDGGYPERIISEALAYVESFHYTDDLRYAVAYISGHESTRSRRRIELDLLNKGIDQDTLDRAWQEWEEQGGTQDEQVMIRELLKKRGYDPETADRKEIQRQGAFLMRRGFSGESVRKALFSRGGFEDY
ncbi:MAG: regulatory protein RecX [Acetatifactor sp.]|nr:regulatory protein RecX [Acetatifactor sp.]